MKIYLTKLAKYFLVPFYFLVLSSSPANAQLPEGAIQKGSLSNQKLIQDTMVGVAAKVSQLGCETPETFLPYVSRLPEGEVGSRTWQEIWVVSGCDGEYPVTIDFREDGANAANWNIK